MPWTKVKYPASMKKLPVAIRNKAIAIANAILKKNKKIAERTVITTAIKQAKAMAAKSKKKTAAKKRTVAKSKSKRVISAKTKRTVKAKTKTSAKKVAKKKVKIAAKPKSKVVSKVKPKKPVESQEETPITRTQELETPKITHGEDLHLIPVAGEVHPVTVEEAHKVENIFHHQQEIAFRRENQRVKESLSTRKSSKPIFRNRGRGQ